MASATSACDCATTTTFTYGFKRSEFGRPYGLEKLGIENVGVFFTRGVLIDVAAYKGVPRMRNGEVISPQDLQGALRRQAVSIREKAK